MGREGRMTETEGEALHLHGREAGQGLNLD